MTDTQLIPDLDTFDVEAASKDELEAVAVYHFGTDIDKRKSLSALKEQVTNLMATKKVEVQAQAEKTSKAQEGGYLKNTGTNAVFPYAELIAKRSDMIPCDKDGNPV